MCKSSSFIRHKQKISVKSLHMDKIIRQLRKQERYKNRVGGKRSSFSPTFRFPTSHTTVRAVPHTAVPILGAIRCMNPSV